MCPHCHIATDPVDRIKCHDIALNWNNREDVVEEWFCPMCAFREVTVMRKGIRINSALLFVRHERKL